MDSKPEEIVELETKIAFLERTCEDLGDVILDQGRAIDALVQRVGRVEARAAAGLESGSDEESLSDQVPPHY